MVYGTDAVKDNAHCPVENLGPEQNGGCLLNTREPRETFIERKHGPKPKLEIRFAPKLEIRFAPLTYSVSVNLHSLLGTK